MAARHARLEGELDRCHGGYSSGTRHVFSAGGLILAFRGEPQFSYVNANLIYGNDNASGNGRRRVYQYDFSSGIYTQLIDLDTVVANLGDTYIGGIISSSGPVEKLSVFFGGNQQDEHHYVIVFNKANPSVRTVVNTLASTINGAATNIPLNFRLHRAFVDRSGRYVILSPTSADRQPPRDADSMYILDLNTNTVVSLPDSAVPFGHDAVGFGVWVNKDCCTSSTWDAGQWQYRSLATPTVTRDLISPILTPQEVYLDDHQSWHNAQAAARMPFITAPYRYGNNTTPWRAWDDEIIAVQMDVAAGSGATVWRFAHHRTDSRDDVTPTNIYFWYSPRPNVSHDGAWAIFTSNWEKTLGTDPQGDANGSFRQDVFLVRLQ